MKTTLLFKILPACLVLASSSIASAITIGAGVIGGSGDVENVLFNEIGLISSGPTVTGTFNQSDEFTVEFSSSSGDLQTPAQGAARIEGLNNDPFTNLFFALTNGDTFTKAQFDIDVVDDGDISFQVFYDGLLNPFELTLDVDGAGSNFFTVLAEGSERISSISFTTTVGMADIQQVRIGGMGDGNTRNVPDGGTTLALFGVSLLGLGCVRRKLA